MQTFKQRIKRILPYFASSRWGIVVAILAFEQIPINRPAVEPGRRSCLEPAKRKAERRQLLCQPDGGAITQPTP